MAIEQGYRSSILSLLLNGVAISLLADNTATTPSTVWWVSLHEADPTGGTQATSETAYTGYARLSIARSTATPGWTVGTATAAPASALTFGQATSTSTGTLTYAAVGLSSSGAGTLFASGALSPSINYGQNTIPELTTSSSFSLA